MLFLLRTKLDFEVTWFLVQICQNAEGGKGTTLQVKEDFGGRSSLQSLLLPSTPNCAKTKARLRKGREGGGRGGRVVCIMLLHFKRGRDSFMELWHLSLVRWSCRDGAKYNHFHILFETDPQVSMRFPSIEITVRFLALALRRLRSPIRSL